jgi:hypothetical protein
MGFAKPAKSIRAFTPVFAGLWRKRPCELNPSYRLQPAHHQPVQPRRERGRVGGQPAIENLRLIEQQRRQISHVVVARLRLGEPERLDQSVAHVELEDGLGAGAAAGPGEQALEPAIGPVPACDQAGGAVGEALGGAYLRHLLAERAFYRLDHTGISIRCWLGVRGLIKARHEVEVNESASNPASTRTARMRSSSQSAR